MNNTETQTVKTPEVTLVLSAHQTKLSPRDLHTSSRGKNQVFRYISLISHEFKSILRVQASHSPALPPLPIYDCTISAGPSPTDDCSSLILDLNRHLVQNPAATFFAYAFGRLYKHCRNF
jgi:hypothetical protein